MDEEAAAKYVDDFLSGKMGLAPREALANRGLPPPSQHKCALGQQ